MATMKLLQAVMWIAGHGFDVVLWPVHLLGGCTTASRFELLPHALPTVRHKAAENGDYFIYVGRNGNGKEAAWIFPYPRPEGQRSDILNDRGLRGDFLPDEYWEPRINDGVNYFERYVLVGLHAADFE